jgi:hypothetical protein
LRISQGQGKFGTIVEPPQVVRDMASAAAKVQTERALNESGYSVPQRAFRTLVYGVLKDSVLGNDAAVFSQLAEATLKQLGLVEADGSLPYYVTSKQAKPNGTQFEVMHSLLDSSFKERIHSADGDHVNIRKLNKNPEVSEEVKAAVGDLDLSCIAASTRNSANVLYRNGLMQYGFQGIYQRPYEGPLNLFHDEKKGWHSEVTFAAIKRDKEDNPFLKVGVRNEAAEKKEFGARSVVELHKTHIESDNASPSAVELMVLSAKSAGWTTLKLDGDVEQLKQASELCKQHGLKLDDSTLKLLKDKGIDAPATTAAPRMGGATLG